LEDLQSLVLHAVSGLDPLTRQPYLHGRWLTFPTAEVRVRHETRKTLFTPFDDPNFQAHDVEHVRMTLIITEVPPVDGTLAQRAKGVKAPGEPTEVEVLEHHLTHLPFASWCKICVQSKSKQNRSRILKTRQPIVHTLETALVSHGSLC